MLTFARLLAVLLFAFALPAGAQSAPPAADEFVANGVRLWYRVAGTSAPGSPPVVFLHGGPGQGSQHFDALVGPYLEPRLRMVYFDQRGSGRSERPWTQAYSIALLVQDVEALRARLGAERIALVGHSFGGLLALEYAAAHSERVSHLVFVAGLWNAPRQCSDRLRSLASRRPNEYARVAGDTLDADGQRRSDCELELRAVPSSERAAYDTALMFPTPAVEARLDSVNAAEGVRNTGEIGRALFGQGLLSYRFSRFDRLTMPVLVMGGGRDGAVPLAGLRDLASRLPDARLVEYRDSGHFVYLDEPARFACDVAAFVSGAAGACSP